MRSFEDEFDELLQIVVFFFARSFDGVTRAVVTLFNNLRSYAVQNDFELIRLFFCVPKLVIVIGIWALVFFFGHKYLNNVRHTKLIARMFTRKHYSINASLQKSNSRMIEVHSGGTGRDVAYTAAVFNGY